MTFRWAVICQACYSILDNEYGLAEVAGAPLNLGLPHEKRARS